MSDKIRIVGIVGSLRNGSYNRALMNAAVELAPENATLEIAEISEIPVYNQDDEKKMPASAMEFKRKVKEADAILFATPEYNYSIPGGLKNAIDFASRPYTDNSWEGKPVAIMSASNGMLGASRAQYHLRQTFVFLNMHALNKPEVIVPSVAQKIGADGRLADEHTRKKIKELLEALVAFTITLQKK
ncbi:MAG: NAD(P)H-dependent oxidoreductase [Candidatus Micrarchaeota archaeon]|nr:NAD(P)H-dependent oxidoreductase [Candidatus Micrarchaeota archaeon]MDE1848244.1 NAD(P)H-dependent oxidoreductase [Candidatus Micrarchaeota archaeon]MDE1864902.1 NAD(P)H-dependent oxidoreductase [Candidatus Micrarchaeota archaeon]